MISNLTAFQLIGHMRESVIITDVKGTIQAVNPAFTQVTGYSAEEAVGRNPKILKSGRQGRNFYASLWMALQKSGGWQGEIWNRRKNGEVYPEWLTITAIRDARGETTHYLGIFTDITGRKLSERRLTRLALYDSITHLPNRILFQDRLTQALAQAHRDEHTVAVLFLDIDYFKRVNDSLGHLVGDNLLALSGRRLKTCMREGDTVARLGGDEFAAVLPITVHLDALKVAHKVLAEVSKPFPLGDKGISITISIGISFYPQDGRDAQMLLQRADKALYRAKELGRNNYQFFNTDAAG